MPLRAALVNSGRLSVPAFLTQSALNTPDADAFAGDMVPGAPMDDAPMQVAGQDAWLLDQLGNRFQLLVFVDDRGGAGCGHAGAAQGAGGRRRLPCSRSS